MKIKFVMTGAALVLSTALPLAVLAGPPSNLPSVGTKPPAASSTATTASTTTTTDENGVNVKGVKDPWTQSDERMRRLEKGLPCVGCDAAGADPQKLPWYLQTLKAGFQPPPPQSDADALTSEVVKEGANPSNLRP